MDLCRADDHARRRIISRAGSLVADFQYDCVPPVFAGRIMKIISEETGNSDPYSKEKEYSTYQARKHYPQLKKMRDMSSNKLLTSTEIAASGNIIDYGAKAHFDIRRELEKLFSGLESWPKDRFDYEDFTRDLDAAGRVLYLLDNCGEIYFDKILIEQLLDQGKEVVAAVRGGPVLNDVTMADAVEAGIDNIVRVIDNGTAFPGTVLEHCSRTFVDEFSGADIIISKGQGNFETLESLKDGRIYFLFKVKCPVVARRSGCEFGSIVLKKNS